MVPLICTRCGSRKSTSVVETSPGMYRSLCVNCAPQNIGSPPNQGLTDEWLRQFGSTDPIIHRTLIMLPRQGWPWEKCLEAAVIALAQSNRELRDTLTESIHRSPGAPIFFSLDERRFLVTQRPWWHPSRWFRNTRSRA